MKRNRNCGRAMLAFALILSAAPPAAEAATFLAGDVTRWLGEPAGPGVNEAFLVLDWADSSPAWVWGYRWSGGAPRTGGDLLGAALAEEPRFTLSGLASGFVQNLSWDGGARFQPGFNAGTGAYWNYFVNNAQQADNFVDGAAPVGAHVLPPLGSPYDEGGPGAWVSSNTGLLGRPLVPGSWDGYVYAGFLSTGPGFPVNAPAAIPEPISAVWLAAGAMLAARRRRSLPAA